MVPAELGGPSPCTGFPTRLVARGPYLVRHLHYSVGTSVAGARHRAEAMLNHPFRGVVQGT